MYNVIDLNVPQKKPFSKYDTNVSIMYFIIHMMTPERKFGLMGGGGVIYLFNCNVSVLIDAVLFPCELLVHVFMLGALWEDIGKQLFSFRIQ